MNRRKFIGGASAGLAGAIAALMPPLAQSQVITSTVRNPYVNVLRRGFRNDLQSNDSAGIAASRTIWQNLVNDEPAGTRFVFPHGTYRIDQMISVNKAHFAMEGEASGQVASGGALITTGNANFAGPMFQFADGISASIANIGLTNNHANAGGYEFLGTCQDTLLQRCNFDIGDETAPGTGCALIVYDADGFSMEHSYFRNCAHGASIHGRNLALTVNQFINNAEGLWVSGTSVVLHQTRHEVNGVGTRFGWKYDSGTPGGVVDSIEDFDFNVATYEANDTAMYFHNGSVGRLSNFNIYGTTNAPSGNSDYAIRLDAGGELVTLSNFNIHGGYPGGSAIAINDALLDDNITGFEFRNTAVESLVTGVHTAAKAWTKRTSGGVITQLLQSQAPFMHFHRTDCDA